MGLALELKNTQKLSPSVVQLMSILQMNALELSTYVDDALQENPVFELAEVENHTFHSKIPVRQSASNDERDYIDPLETFCGFSSDFSTLYDSICEQLDAEKENNPCVLSMARLLDRNGYLAKEDYDYICNIYGQSNAKSSLQKLQTLSPAGVGAGDLQECLLLQLERIKVDTAVAKSIVQNHLEDVARSHYNLISRSLGVPLQKVYDACALIRTLNPRPGIEYSFEEAPSYITPDIIMSEDGSLSLNDDWVPTLKISSYYAELVSQTDDKAVRDYLRGKLHQAGWIINNIDQRRRTILSCAQAIVDAQEEFFRSKGKKPICPLVQSDIADSLSISVSTVSRTVNSKYIQCPFGLYSLSFFFSSPVSSASDSASSSYIKSKVKELISSETPGSPLSDQRIAVILQSSNINVSRRAIAKYRGEMRIPCTSQRRCINTNTKS